MLVYFMLQNELPFGSWRDNELDTFGKIVGRQMALPSNLSSGAIDLIDKVKIVYVQTKYIYFLKYEEHRIGLQSYESICPHTIHLTCTVNGRPFLNFGTATASMPMHPCRSKDVKCVGGLGLEHLFICVLMSRAIHAALDGHQFWNFGTTLRSNMHSG